MIRDTSLVEFVRHVVSEARSENVPFMAGSLAYLGLVSLTPLLAMAIYLLGVAGRTGSLPSVIAVLEGATATDITPLLRTIAGYQPTAEASVFGIAILLWASFRVVRGLDTAFSEIYGGQPSASVWERLVDMVIGIGAVLGAAVVASFAFVVVTTVNIPYREATARTILFLGLVVALFPIYYRFPDTDVSVWETVPGVLIAAVGWATVQIVLEAYLMFVGALDISSAFGALLLLLLWLYVGSACLLIGMVVNALLVEDSAPGPSVG